MLEPQSPNKTISLTNSGKTAFIAFISCKTATMRTELKPLNTWSATEFKIPETIRIEVTDESQKFTTRFKPDKEHTYVKIDITSDGTLYCVVDRSRALFFEEQESPTQPASRIRPQTAPAKSSRHHQ